MKRHVLILTALLLGFATLAHASCRSHTLWTADGRIISCTTCCAGASCSTSCF
jgi:hypothetical protein